MILHKHFAGGNRESGNDIYLENEQRDSGADWFYWGCLLYTSDAADEL